MAGWKKYVFIIPLIILTFLCSKGEIKNGYSSQIEGMRESLKALKTLLIEDKNISLFQRAAMKDNINKLLEYITYFELTEELLIQFKIIDPEMYNEMDSIKDYTGHPVVVFVKFVPEIEMQHGAAGTTNLNQSENNKNIYHSEFGVRTVSIKIASVTKSLLLLAHEFGHAKYQIANLSSYVDYYSTYYQNSTFNSRYIGHNSNDPSGKSAFLFEKRFLDKYIHFIKVENIKIESPLAIIQDIRKRISRL